MKYDITRTLVCYNVRKISQLCHTAKSLIRSKLPIVEKIQVEGRYNSLRREATIWNDTASVCKGNAIFKMDISSFDLCAGRGHMVARYNAATKRRDELKKWAEKHPQEAKKICQPLWAEYDEREARREAKHEILCVGA